jgi:hypothetical protein
LLLNFASLKFIKTSHKPILCTEYSYLHDSQPELSGALLCSAAKQKKAGGADKLQIIRLQLTRSLFDYFSKRILESSIHRRICNMVGVITDYF